MYAVDAMAIARFRGHRYNRTVGWMVSTDGPRRRAVKTFFVLTSLRCRSGFYIVSSRCPAVEHPHDDDWTASGDAPWIECTYFGIDIRQIEPPPPPTGRDDVDTRGVWIVC